jgi:quinol-cytochrome oxidoreductase complex cytochrome b subunit
MLFVNGDTVAVALIFLGAVLLFFLPLIDNRPAGRKGKIVTWAAFAFIAYAVGMSIWSLSGPKAQSEKIVPAPQNIKESTAIYVFLGWMWVSIAVLIYFLRQKIRETDRLYFSRYFTPDKE